jgi:hypothetical protein
MNVLNFNDEEECFKINLRHITVTFFKLSHFSIIQASVDDCETPGCERIYAKHLD